MKLKTHWKGKKHQCFTNLFVNRLPHVYKLAFKYLIAQTSSLASECVFSTSGDILSAESSCLEDKSLVGWLFENKNAHS